MCASIVITEIRTWYSTVGLIRTFPNHSE